MRHFLPIFTVLLALLAGCAAPETAGNNSSQPQLPQQPEFPIVQGQAPEQGQAPVTPAETPGNISTPAETGSPQAPPQNGTAGNASQAQTQNQTNPGPENQSASGGLAFGNNTYSIALDDVSLIPSSSEPCGIFSLHSQSGSLIEKMFICPGQSEEWVSPDGGSYRILVVKVAGGYTGQKWAQVIVYG